MLKKPQTTAAVTALSVGGIGFFFLYRKLFSHFIWRLKTKNILKKSKNVFIVNDIENWEKISSIFCRDVGVINAVGFDCEWVQTKGGRRPVAMMQLATYSGISALIRLNTFKKNIPSSLKEILENEKIVKVGVGTELDAQYLFQDYNIMLKGWMDLRHLAIEIDSKKFDNNSAASGEGLGLQTLTKRYLRKDLDKDWRIRSANWEAPKLTQRQINYAAEDALVGIQILLAHLNIVWRPDNAWPAFHLRGWENETLKAIKSTCSPFVEAKFCYAKRHLGDGNCVVNGTVNHQTKIAKELRLSYCTRKSPLYHNSQLWAPDGEPLCTCDPKKLLWYVEKGLGELVSEDPFVVKLKFEPAGRPNREGVDGQFYLQERFNLCVVCGKSESYIRKNIIPHEYRKHFPRILKSHQSHDVVLLCTECHQNSNIRDNTMRYAMAKEFNAPIGCETDVKLTIDGRLKRIRSAGGALKKSKIQLPLERITELENILKDFYNTDVLTDDLIDKAASLDTQIMNDSYLPHGFKVFQFYERIGLILLEERWRQWFLDSMQPKYLPDNWSVSHNHKKLRLKMSRFPLDDKIRQDYKIALVGTEGTIDVPYFPNSQQNPPSSFFGLNIDGEENDEEEEFEDDEDKEEEFSRESTPEVTVERLSI